MKPAAYSVPDVLKMVGISRTKFYQLVSTRQLTVRKIGKRSVVLAEDLEAWLSSLPTYGGGDSGQ